jgi:carboxyl-terminal processing protease
MKFTRLVAVPLIALVLSVPLGMMARAEGDALPGAPTPEQITTAKLVYGLLSDSRYAYRPRPLDDTMSAEIFDHYLEALDRNKLFFTAADIARFEAHKPQMGENVRSGRLEPAYAIFAVYKQRVAERVAYARELLGKDIFDFTGDDRWEYDREDAPWAADRAELDALWRQSVRNDWLRLKLAGKKPDEIRKTLDRRYLNLGNNVAALNQEDAFQSFLNAYTSTVDPHTDYMNPRTAKLFTQNMSLSLEGIGAQLQKQDDVVVIREAPAGRWRTWSAGAWTTWSRRSRARRAPRCAWTWSPARPPSTANRCGWCSPARGSSSRSRRPSPRSSRCRPRPAAAPTSASA